MSKVQFTFELETNATPEQARACAWEHLANIADHLRAEGHTAIPYNTMTTKLVEPRVPRLLTDSDFAKELPSHTKFLITTLEKAGLATRHYQGKTHCTDLAHAIYILYMHLCQLDGENLRSWDISTHTLCNVIGSASRSRTFGEE